MSIEKHYRPAALEHYRSTLDDSPVAPLAEGQLGKALMLGAATVSLALAGALAADLPRKTTVTVSCNESGDGRIVDVTGVSDVRALRDSEALTVKVGTAIGAARPFDALSDLCSKSPNQQLHVPAVIVPFKNPPA